MQEKEGVGIGQEGMGKKGDRSRVGGEGKGGVGGEWSCSSDRHPMRKQCAS